MILAPVAIERGRAAQSKLETKTGRVTPVERIARYGHGGDTVSLGARVELAWLVERKLFDRGCAVAVVEHASSQMLEALEQAGLLVLLVSNRPPDWELPDDDELAADSVIATMEETGILPRKETLTGGEGSSA